MMDWMKVVAVQMSEVDRSKIYLKGRNDKPCRYAGRAE